MDLDPVFVRGLRLLHSRSRDSTEQLRALLDEVRLRSGRNGGKRSPASMSPRSTSGLTRSDPGLKRSVDKLKEDSGELSSKRARVDSPVAFKSHTPSPTMSRDSDASKKSEDSDLNDTGSLEMNFMDQLACVVCRVIGVGNGNQLIECHECGNLYHQECHRPPITEQERGDTRSVWLCSNCREQQILSSSSSVPPAGSGGSRPGAGISLLKTKVISKPVVSLHLPKAGAQSAAVVKPPLAAKASAGSRSVPGSPSAGKTTTGTHPPPNSMISAERRMQLMKKKAAAKLNEKRKN